MKLQHKIEPPVITKLTNRSAQTGKSPTTKSRLGSSMDPEAVGMLRVTLTSFTSVPGSQIRQPSCSDICWQAS